MPTFNIALRYVPSCLQWILMVMEWFLPNTFSRKKPGVTVRGQLASTRACKMLPGSEKLSQDTISDQRPAQYSRVIFLPTRGGQASAECGDSPVSQSPLVTTSPLLQQSHLLPVSSGGQEQQGPAAAAPPWEHENTVSPCDWGGGDSCTAAVSPECRG